MSADQPASTDPIVEEQQENAAEEYTEEEKKLGQDFIAAVIAGDLVRSFRTIE
jgi:hypothetical protein